MIKTLLKIVSLFFVILLSYGVSNADTLDGLVGEGGSVQTATINLGKGWNIFSFEGKTKLKYATGCNILKYNKGEYKGKNAIFGAKGTNFLINPNNVENKIFEPNMGVLLYAVNSCTLRYTYVCKSCIGESTNTTTTTCQSGYSKNNNGVCKKLQICNYNGGSAQPGIIGKGLGVKNNNGSIKFIKVLSCSNGQAVSRNCRPSTFSGVGPYTSPYLVTSSCRDYSGTTTGTTTNSCFKQGSKCYTKQWCYYTKGSGPDIGIGYRIYSNGKWGDCTNVVYKKDYRESGFSGTFVGRRYGGYFNGTPSQTIINNFRNSGTTGTTTTCQSGYSKNNNGVCKKLQICNYNGGSAQPGIIGKGLGVKNNNGSIKFIKVLSCSNGQAVSRNCRPSTFSGVGPFTSPYLVTSSCRDYSGTTTGTTTNSCFKQGSKCYTKQWCYYTKGSGPNIGIGYRTYSNGKWGDCTNVVYKKDYSESPFSGTFIGRRYGGYFNGTPSQTIINNFRNN